MEYLIGKYHSLCKKLFPDTTKLQDDEVYYVNFYNNFTVQIKKHLYFLESKNIVIIINGFRN